MSHADNPRDMRKESQANDAMARARANGWQVGANFHKTRPSVTTYSTRSSAGTTPAESPSMARKVAAIVAAVAAVASWVNVVIQLMEV